MAPAVSVEEPQVQETRSASGFSAQASQDDISVATYRAILIVVTLAATAIRFWHLSDRSFWIDEGASYILTQLPWSKFFYAIRTCMGEMGLYYFILRLWAVMGTTEFALRSFSVLCSVATVPLIGSLATKLYSRKAGALTASIFAFHVWGIYFAREARSYPLVTLTIIASWLLLLRAVQQSTTRNWLLFSVLTAITCYVHFLSILNVTAQLLSLALVCKNKTDWKQLFRTTFWIFLGCLPVAAYISQTHGGAINWIQGTKSNVVHEFIDEVTGWWSAGFEIYAFAALLGVLAYFAFRAWKKHGQGMETWKSLIPFLGIAVPVFGLMLISTVKHAFLPRYLQFVVAFVALALGYLGSQLKPSSWAVSLVLFCAFFLKPLSRYYHEPSYYNIRGAVQYIAMRAQPDDLVYIWEPLTRPAFQYYAQQVPGFPQIAFPRTADTFQIEDYFLRPDPYVTPGQMKSRHRVWVVYDFNMAPKQVGPVAYFYYVVAQTSGHKLVSEYHSQNVQVYEFVRPDETANSNTGN